MMRTRAALLCGVLAVGCAGCAGADPCVGVTCTQGRTCIAGHCVLPDGQFTWPDLGVAHDTVGPVDGVAANDLTLPDALLAPDASPAPDAPPAPDTGGATCPDPNKAAGSYKGTFADSLGGLLGKGTVTFTLSASGPQSMKLSGSITGTALPSLYNYPINATITGGVSCATITTSMSGTLHTYSFAGYFNGTLQGTTTMGAWYGKQTGGNGLEFTGAWQASRQ